MFGFKKNKSKKDSKDSNDSNDKVQCRECWIETDDVDEDGFCGSCSRFLTQSGWDAVDPDHNFDSYNDWDENGH